MGVHQRRKDVRDMGKSYLGQTNSSEELVSISGLHGLRAICVSFDCQDSFQQLNGVRQAALTQQKACQLVLTISIAGQSVHHSSQRGRHR